MVFHHENVTEETDVAVSLFDDDRCAAGIDYRNAEVAPRFTIKQLI